MTGTDRWVRVDDRRLGERLAAGDADALAEAFEAHADRLFRVAYGITRSVRDAEDVVQDVFVALPEKVATFRGRSPFGGWIYRVAVRSALMRVRAEGRHRDLLKDFRGFKDPKADRPLDRLAVERAFDSVPALHRTVLWLKAVEGWTHAEIAEALGISEDASAQRYHRARKLLAGAIDDREDAEC